MKNAKELYNDVKKILEDKPITRVDDHKLYYEYFRIKFYMTDKTSNVIEIDCMFAEIFINISSRKALGISPYSAVERARRKVQVDYPELAVEKVVRARYNKTSEYIDFSQGYDANLS